MLSGLPSARGSQGAIDRNLTASSMGSAGRVRGRTTPLLPETGHAVGLGVVPELGSVADDTAGPTPAAGPSPARTLEYAARKSLGGQRAPAGACSRGLPCPSRNSRRGDGRRSGLRLPRLATPGWLSRGLSATHPKARGEAKVAPACQVLRIAFCLDSSLRRLGRYAIVPRKALRCGCRRIERA